MKYLVGTLTVFCALARGATLFLGAYPNSILVFDEAKGQVIDRIPLSTGLPTAMKLSDDKKRIYVTTNDHSGIEVIDVATRHVINHFALNTATKRYRFNGGTPDPEGKLFYTVTTEMDKRLEHYDVGKPQYTVIDLAQQKIVKTVQVASEDEDANAGYGRGFEISPDGKYLYQFRDRVVILSTADFKVVERIELSKPEFAGGEMENIGFGSPLDSINEPGQHISLFNSWDPIVHNRIFGIARFDLTTREVNFTPIGRLRRAWRACTSRRTRRLRTRWSPMERTVTSAASFGHSISRPTAGRRMPSSLAARASALECRETASNSTFMEPASKSRCTTRRA